MKFIHSGLQPEVNKTETVNGTEILNRNLPKTTPELVFWEGKEVDTAWILKTIRILNTDRIA